MKSTSSLIAWPVGPGLCMIQTSNPAHARRLRQRRDTRLAAVGVRGGFLRIYAIDRPIGFCERLVRRYTRKVEATNAAKSSRIHAPARANRRGNTNTAGGLK